jgi:hypothetical protein
MTAEVNSHPERQSVWKLMFALICHLERSERSRIISYIENKISPLRLEMTITTHSDEERDLYQTEPPPERRRRPVSAVNISHASGSFGAALAT